MKKKWIALFAALLLLSGCAAGPEPEVGSVSGSGDVSGIGGAPESRSAGSLPDRSELSMVGTEDEGDTKISDYLPPAPEELFKTMPKEFAFMSGVGAWATELHLAEDGSFTGLFHDSNMGEDGEEYPNGTVYFCAFSGEFSEPVQVNDYTFSTHVIELTQEAVPGEITYEDGFRFICDIPAGLAGADEVLIYCPNAPTAELPEELLSWIWPLHNVFGSETLNCYGLYNVNEGLGFADYDYEEG